MIKIICYTGLLQFPRFSMWILLLNKRAIDNRLNLQK